MSIITEEQENYMDDIQNHMLGLVISIMDNYGITPAHINAHYGYISEIRTDESKKEIIYVAHRREFRDALSKGLKICSNYMNCSNNNCERFHVLEENLCPHAGKSNYCDDNACEKIVIKACRRGTKCNDNSCSFRH